MSKAFISEKSCGIIPLRETSTGYQVLLVRHRAGDYWGFPKGHVEEYEDPLDTATRELKEETGLELDELVTKQTLTEQYRFLRNGQDIEKSVVYFVAKVSGALKTDAEDVTEARWCYLCDAALLITFDDSKAILAKIHKML